MKMIDQGWGKRSGLMDLLLKHEDLRSDTQNPDEAGTAEYNVALEEETLWQVGLGAQWPAAKQSSTDCGVRDFVSKTNMEGDLGRS